MPSSRCAPKSAKRTHWLPFIPIWVTAALSLGLVSCGSKGHGGDLFLGDSKGPNAAPGATCDTPTQGCSCDSPGQVVECGRTARRSGDYLSCAMGKRTCDEGKWGACIGDGIATLYAPIGQPRTQKLGAGVDCPDNPCDPYCRLQVDDATDLPLPAGGGLVDNGGLQLTPRAGMGGVGLCTGMTVVPSAQTLTVTRFGERGLKGEYFDQLDLEADFISSVWVPKATRIDPNIDFDWQPFGDPGLAGMPNSEYSVRWTGAIVAPTTEPFTLCAPSDDGNRVWVDDVLFSDGWFVFHQEECSPPLNWSAGSVHSLRYEFFQDFGGAFAQLTWATPTIAKQPIPPSAYQRVGSAALPTVSGTAKFNVELSPPGCFPGTPQPAWTLDRLDNGTIGQDGQVGLVGASAGPMTATAYLGKLSASGTVDVVVQIADNDDAPAGSVTAFQAAAAGTDPAVLLLPANDMLLPIGVPPAQVQWNTMGAAASAVKVRLVYPATGTPSFDWSAIMPEATPARALIPPQIWKAFEQSAKGNAAEVSVQRLVNGQVMSPMRATVNFASAPAAPAVCHPAGSTVASSCEVDADCCGGASATRTAACRFDTPIGNPPLRHCRALPPGGVCAAAGQSCAVTSDCCMALACVGATCVTPPTAVGYGPENFERVYHSDCPKGTKVAWRFFDWKAETPNTASKLEFFAETQADSSAFAVLPLWPLPVEAESVVPLGTATGPTLPDWVGAAVSQLLDKKSLKSQEYLKVTVRFAPNQERSSSPVLKAWRQSYSCVPGE